MIYFADPLTKIRSKFRIFDFPSEYYTHLECERTNSKLQSCSLYSLQTSALMASYGLLCKTNSNFWSFWSTVDSSLLVTFRKQIINSFLHIHLIAYSSFSTCSNMLVLFFITVTSVLFFNSNWFFLFIIWPYLIKLKAVWFMCNMMDNFWRRLWLMNCFFYSNAQTR